MPQHTVLVVDDSPTAGPELKSLLESEGYTVLLALRAEEALDMLGTARVDLVITEALLPGTDGFELVRQIRRNERFAELPIIMLTVRSAPEDYASSYEAGADEYFLKPMEPAKIVAATRGLITKFEAARIAARSVRTAPPKIGRREPGKIIVVFSLKGGVGTTTIAVNLAVAIKQLTPSSHVGLLDLSLEEGLDALLLDIVPTSTIAEWAREDMIDATPQLLSEYFTQHGTGVALMPAPASPEQAETVRPDVVRRTLQLAPDVFDYVVVDTASSFSENTLTALEAAANIVLPLTPDMAALKTTVNTLRILKAVNISDNKVRVVLNEIIPRAGLSKGQVDSSLSRETHYLPFAGPAFVEASNHGTPLVSTQPTLLASRAIQDFARTVCQPEEVIVEAEPEGLLGRLRPRFGAR